MPRWTWRTRDGELQPADEAVLRLAQLSARLARCPDLDSLVEPTLAGLDELFGYENSLLLLLDESRRAALHDRQPRLPERGRGLRGAHG